MACLPTISRGDGFRGKRNAQPAVEDAQGRLQDLGFLAGDPDGLYGQKTEEAVVAFQERRDLPVTGEVDSRTWSELYEAPRTPEEEHGVLPYKEKVSKSFALEVRRIAMRLEIDPAWLMAVMAFETGGTFDPAQKNLAGSSGTGLIQFMSFTARGLGTTTEKLAKMTAVQQLAYVEKYLRPYAGRMTTLEDLYMAVLWPAAVGKRAGYVLFRRPTLAYRQNRGLDSNGNGEITKWEAASKVRKALERGLAPSQNG